MFGITLKWSLVELQRMFSLRVAVTCGYQIPSYNLEKKIISAFGYHEVALALPHNDTS